MFEWSSHCSLPDQLSESSHKEQELSDKPRTTYIYILFSRYLKKKEENKEKEKKIVINFTRCLIVVYIRTFICLISSFVALVTISVSFNCLEMHNLMRSVFLSKEISYQKKIYGVLREFYSNPTKKNKLHSFVKNKKADSCTINEATSIWLETHNAKMIDLFNDRFDMALTEYHLLAYILDPWYCDIKLTDDQLDSTLSCVNMYHQEIMSEIITFQARTFLFKDYLFSESTVKNIKPLTWWLALKKI
ncbi:hypothetical protein QTP88_007132 [Uroleucon formosanum]